MILIFGSVILNKVLCASAKMLDSIFEGTVDKSTKLNAMHIFQDGNGRTSRLIMNYQLMINGFLPVSIAKENRLEYYNALEEYAVSGKLGRFSELIGALEEEQLDIYIALIKQDRSL